MQIRFPEVRVIGFEDETQNGLYPIAEALRLAEELQLDLVLIAPNAVPPVCRVVEYSKFKYELKKREKANKAKQATTSMKEIRFGPNIDDHDFNFKLKHAIKFLEEGNKLRAYVQFRGRNIIYKDRGKSILDRFAEELEDLAKVEMEARMEGRRMVMIMVPKAGKKG
jgi:translation initiation factor IF-3